MREFDPIIEIIEEEYEIPHLGATRKISALLPHDYYKSSKSYPVLYLQDGQNLFNPRAPFGDWAIDKSMAKLAAQGFNDLIIIAIDHGEKERIREYLPYDHPRFGKGQGRFYIRFMDETLIPYVNRHYRTLSDYSHTGIGGSSMGGLISLFAGLTKPEVFGKMMIFSPSLWMSKMIFRNAAKFAPQPGSKIYIYAGGQESKMHLPNVRNMEAILVKEEFKPMLDVKLSINERGEHAEVFWRKEFPLAVKWLFFNDQTN